MSQQLMKNLVVLFPSRKIKEREEISRNHTIHKDFLTSELKSTGEYSDVLPMNKDTVLPDQK